MVPFGLPDDPAVELHEAEALAPGGQALGEGHLHGVLRRRRGLRGAELPDEAVRLVEHAAHVQVGQGELQPDRELDAGEPAAVGGREHEAGPGHPRRSGERGALAAGHSPRTALRECGRGGGPVKPAVTASGRFR